MTPAEKIIRPFAAGDLDAVVRVWHRAGTEAYTYLPAWRDFPLERARSAFVADIQARCELWVGVAGGAIAGFMAMRGSYIDRLYVDPAHQRQGWGTAFVRHAMRLSPAGLELHTHQENTGACTLYERLGFVAVAFGLSPAPENVPDVEYHWRPVSGAGAVR